MDDLVARPTQAADYAGNDEITEPFAEMPYAPSEVDRA